MDTMGVQLVKTKSARITLEINNLSSPMQSDLSFFKPTFFNIPDPDHIALVRVRHFFVSLLLRMCFINISCDSNLLFW